MRVEGAGCRVSRPARARGCRARCPPRPTAYKGASLVRNIAPLGPYSRTIPRGPEQSTPVPSRISSGVWGLGFRGQGAAPRATRPARAPGCRARCPPPLSVLGKHTAGFRMQGAGCRGQGSGCRVQGPGSRVQGAGARPATTQGCRARCPPRPPAMRVQSFNYQASPALVKQYG